MARQRYSDTQRAEALAALDANGGNVAHTARQTGIPRGTLILWRDGQVSEDVSELRQEKRAGLAERLEALAHTILDLLPEKMQAASAKDAAVAFAIAVDKMQLLKGEPTSITQEQGLTDDERAARIAELLERGESRARAAASNGPGTRGVRPATPLH